MRLVCLLILLNSGVFLSAFELPVRDPFVSNEQRDLLNRERSKRSCVVQISSRSYPGKCVTKENVAKFAGWNRMVVPKEHNRIKTRSVGRPVRKWPWSPVEGCDDVNFVGCSVRILCQRDRGSRGHCSAKNQCFKGEWRPNARKCGEGMGCCADMGKTPKLKAREKISWSKSDKYRTNRRLAMSRLVKGPDIPPEPSMRFRRDNDKNFEVKKGFCRADVVYGGQEFCWRYSSWLNGYGMDRKNAIKLANKYLGGQFEDMHKEFMEKVLYFADYEAVWSHFRARGERYTEDDMKRTYYEYCLFDWGSDFMMVMSQISRYTAATPFGTSWTMFLNSFNYASATLLLNDFLNDGFADYIKSSDFKNMLGKVVAGSILCFDTWVPRLDPDELFVVGNLFIHTLWEGSFGHLQKLSGQSSAAWLVDYTRTRYRVFFMEAATAVEEYPPSGALWADCLKTTITAAVSVAACIASAGTGSAGGQLVVEGWKGAVATSKFILDAADKLLTTQAVTNSVMSGESMKATAENAFGYVPFVGAAFALMDWFKSVENLMAHYETKRHWKILRETFGCGFLSMTCFPYQHYTSNNSNCHYSCKASIHSVEHIDR